MKNLQVFVLLLCVTCSAPVFSMHVFAARFQQVASHLPRPHVMQQGALRLSQQITRRSCSSQHDKTDGITVNDILKDMKATCSGAMVGMFLGKSVGESMCLSAAVNGIGQGIPEEFGLGFLMGCATIGAVIGARARPAGALAWGITTLGGLTLVCGIKKIKGE
jgi:hypothetical protein